MNFAKFSVYTFLGCVPGVFALTYFGHALGERIGNFLRYLDRKPTSKRPAGKVVSSQQLSGQPPATGVLILLKANS